MEDSTSMQVDSPKSSGPLVSSEGLESVVHFMLGELMRVGKLALLSSVVDAVSLNILMLLLLDWYVGTARPV